MPPFLLFFIFKRFCSILLSMDTQSLCFIFFLLGALTVKVLQALLSIIKSYSIFKFTEHYCITIMTEIETWRYQSLAIVKLCYEEAGREEEFAKVEQKIHEKFTLFQQNILGILKANLPYRTDYSNLMEAYKKLQEEQKNG